MLECRQLRIKCDEGKPICEYCSHTARECTYPEVKPLKRELARLKRLEKLARLNQLDAAPAFEFSVDYNGTKGDELTRELVLTQSTSMLGITKFELRLVRFFDQECIKLFSYGVDETVDKCMKEKVPYLFLQSDLVRKSIFCISAMVFSSVIDLNMVQSVDMSEDKRSLENFYNINPKDPNSLYTKNIEYFLDAISCTRRLIEAKENSPIGANLKDPAVAKQFTTASILIFCYLGITPHKLVPVIDFTKKTPDIIQIAKGMRAAMYTCIPIVMESDLSPLLGHQPLVTPLTPTLKLCTYPVIVDLMSGLEEFYDSCEVSLEASEEIALLHEAIHLLIASIHTCVCLKLPLPIYRFLFLLSDGFRDLLYQRHRYALRVLFVYSALCSITRCHFDTLSNVWRDFMMLYSTEGYLDAEMDKRLYDLVFFEDFGWTNYYEFHTLDPCKL
ncbi:hypothetical protein Cantr_06856 [Candida viswanathii]|uniref:Zn(2)-C6 fungal-type domain-containing protein n=1 Tax=Candida viswanathii TaxID=5486 RepID=A0A367XWZ4_9ASCO|nr:hypothetical protein Cantr_06856 [Candida viswanathii]